MRNKTMKRQRGGLFDFVNFMNQRAKNVKKRVGRVFSGTPPHGVRQQIPPQQRLYNQRPKQYRMPPVQCPLHLPPSDFTDAHVQAYDNALTKLTDAEVQACFKQLLNDKEARKFYDKYKKRLDKKMEYYSGEEPPPLNEDPGPPQGGRRTKKQTRRNSKR